MSHFRLIPAPGDDRKWDILRGEWDILRRKWDIRRGEWDMPGDARLGACC